VLDLRIGEDGAVAADVVRAELAAAAVAERAFHVALEREVDPLGRETRFAERRYGEAHHHLRPADERRRALSVEPGQRDERRDDADATAQVCRRGVDRHGELDPGPLGPACELSERLGPAHLAAIGLLIAGQAALVGEAGTIAFGTGEAMILAATLLWAIEVVLVKWLLRSLASPTLAAARLGLGTLILLGYVLVSGRGGDLAALSANQWGWALLTGTVLTGYVATWYAALARAQAVDVTAVLVFAVVITAVLDAGVHGIALDLFGLGLIGLGVALIVQRVLRPGPDPELARA
jgi:uncharacterized membrane protein